MRERSVSFLWRKVLYLLRSEESFSLLDVAAADNDDN